MSAQGSAAPEVNATLSSFTGAQLELPLGDAEPTAVNGGVMNSQRFRVDLDRLVDHYESQHKHNAVLYITRAQMEAIRKLTKFERSASNKIIAPFYYRGHRTVVVEE
jgi:hypothetical protein